MTSMFKKYRSPNFNERSTGQNPSLIIVHYTGMKNAKAALERLCDLKSEVSAHYLIEENGKTHALVPEGKRAWHAGLSYWKGETDINSASIGIELVNPGHEFGYQSFPPKQIKALVKLCKDIMTRHAIPPGGVLGHSDIAPGRKIDPGHLFPWDELAQNGIGLWPAPTKMDIEAATALIQGDDVIFEAALQKLYRATARRPKGEKTRKCESIFEKSLHELLCAYGYNPQIPPEETLVEFHRHYAPEKFTSCDDKPAEADVATCAKLLSLIRKNHENNN